MGRVVIPAEFRKALGLNMDDVVDITITGKNNDCILIKKQENDHDETN
jgi:bifunctional DNA-binding transcriptional regulator/antitoxin component of YhaV-PrlF toxin-antitoxin module